MNGSAQSTNREQTHFIGVLAPEGLADQLNRCRAWMGDSFGCRSGFSTPIHVTIIPPFSMKDDEMVLRLLAALSTNAASQSPFIAQVSGFGSFAERTLFARVVPDDRWNQLQKNLYTEIFRACPGAIRADNRPFTPHLTVANRDIPPEAIPVALCHFAEILLEDAFPIEEYVLFNRITGSWKPYRFFPFLNI
jgi:2'-5' RNA ligase